METKKKFYLDDIINRASNDITSEIKWVENVSVDGASMGWEKNCTVYSHV